METKQTKEILEVNLAAYLLTDGFPLIGPPRQSSHFVVFPFEASKKLDQAIENFYSKTTRVDALTFTENLYRVRSLVRQSKRGEVGDNV
jgi:hypothetical protein